MPQNAKVEESGNVFFSTACVFLPENDPNYGIHARSTFDDVEERFCYKLYGEPKEWGCQWFEVWRQQVEKVLERGQKPVVVYKEGEVGQGDSTHWDDFPIKFSTERKGLGGSQAGEVAYLRKRLQDQSFLKKDVRDVAKELQLKAGWSMKKVFRGHKGGMLLAGCLRKCGAAHTGLRSLVLVEAGIGEAAGVELAKALPLLRQLEELNLFNNALGKASGHGIAKALPDPGNLQLLNLRCNPVGEEAGLQIANSLRFLPKLKNLDIISMGIGEAAGRQVIKTLPELLELQVLFCDGGEAQDELMEAWRAIQERRRKDVPATSGHAEA